ncbi:MAG: adenylate/guanylate cyclase domain-containing protein, partial [Halothece sp.]
LVIPVGENYRLLNNTNKEIIPLVNLEKFNVVYQFSHEFIQEAVYSLIPLETRQETYLKMSQILFQKTTLDDLDSDFFEIVNLLNLGKAVITEVDRKYQLAELNFKAGEKAKNCAAYSEALYYFSVGLSLLENNCWDTHYEFTLLIHSNCLECEYLTGNIETAESLFKTTLAKVRTDVEKVNLYALIIYFYANLNKEEKAVALGIEALKQFGIDLENESLQIAIASLQSLIDSLMGEREISALIDLPKMQDEKQLAILALLKNLASPTYSNQRELWPLIILKMVEISLEFGNTDISSFAYMTYGVLLNSQFSNPQAGYQFGKLALRIHEKFPNVQLSSEIYFLFGAFINSSTHSLKGDFYYLQKSFNDGKEHGNLNFTACAANVLVAETYLKGELLDQVSKNTEKYINWVQKIQAMQSLYFQKMVQRVSLCLQGFTEDPFDLKNGELGEEDFLAKLETLQLEIPLQFYYLIKMQFFYLLGDGSKALAMAKESEKRLSNCLGLLRVSEHYFYYSLTLASLYEKVSEEDKANYFRILQENREKLRSFSENCPSNFEHKYLLVAAEIARLSDSKLEGMELYDAAIASAKENEYLQNEALANELAAKFYLAQGKEKIAKVYLIDARQAYQKWGAKTKVKMLENTYPELLSELSDNGITKVAIASNSNTLTATTGNASFDLNIIMKAAQTLSSEIVLDQLLKKMMKILLENAGAQLGVLMLNNENKLMIEALGRIDQEEVEVFQSIPVEGCESIPVTLINYVKRTKEYVVLNNAATDGLFTNDPYILQTQPKSILCTPILNQGKLIGILYIENNLSTGAFTKDRLKILQILSSQSAISIENARLYSNLEESLKTQVQLNEAYGRFVPHEILQFLSKESIVDVQLGDQVQTEMTILFVDIRSFTTLSETMSPKENFNFLNSYLSRVSPIIRNHNGFIDKYIGDAIMALFPNQADDAVKAAIAIQNEVVRYNIHRQRSGYPPIAVGIGIHTGSLMLGTIGESRRLEGTVISDAVNLASRLEGLTKEYGSLIIVSGQTLIHLQDAVQFNYRFIDKVKVKGKNKYVAVFEIFDSDPLPIMQLKHQTRQQFEQAVLRYHNKDMTEANELFQSILQLNPEDKAAQLYFKRCGYLN